MSTARNNEEDSRGDAVSLELVGDPYVSIQPPFDPCKFGLSYDFRLTKFGDTRGKSSKLDRSSLQKLFADLDEEKAEIKEGDVSSTSTIIPVTYEDTSVTKLERNGMCLVETNNLLCPIVDDPNLMGKIACATVLSGIYSLGISDISSTRITLALSNRMEENERNVVASMTIRGYRDTAKTDDAPISGCQILINPWYLIGGTATAICSPHELVTPDGATIGDVIVLTKPLGTMVAITVSQWMDHPEKRNRLLLAITEEETKKAHYRAIDSMIRTNRAASILMRKYNAHAACEVATHGILGHAEILARRQRNAVNFVIHNMPVIAKMNSTSKITGNSMPLLQGLMPEISGGLLIVLPREQAAAYCKALEKIEQRQAWIIGIVENGNRTARVIDRPRVIEVPTKDPVGSLW